MSRAASLLVALVVLLLAAAPAPAAEFTKKALTFDVTTGPKNDTPCRITADLYTPAGASKASPAAAILATNGFGGSKNEFADLAPSYARRGYVFLAYSGLGFGGSGCKIHLDDPDWDGKAGTQLVTFLGRQDYVIKDGPGDPRVGMIGGSYGGQIQFAIAGQDPRMDALVPQITWNDLAYSLTPNDTDFERGVSYRTPGVVKIDWPVLFFGLGVGQGLQASAQDPSHLGPCPNFADEACPALLNSAGRGYPTPETVAFLRHASVQSYVSRIRIPTLLSQGQSDTLFDLQEAVATWQALRAQNTPVKMIWRSSGHSGGSIDGENDEERPEAAYESRMALSWFDFYLRGIGDPPQLDFSFFREWAPYQGDAAPAVGSTASYPAGADRRLFLSSDNALVGAPSGVKDGSVSMAAVPGAPTGTGGAAINPGVPAGETPGTAVAFETAALPADTDVVGVPKLTVRLDAPTFAASQGGDPLGKLVLFAKLYDVDPAGGKAVLPRDQISAVRVADVTKPVTIELPGIAHRFAKGHTMRLVLATSDLSYRGNTVAGPVSVTLDQASPSTLTVPVLGRQLGATGAGPDGTTRFESPPGAPPSQPAGLGGLKSRGRGAAALPRTCASRRRFTIRLRRPPRGDRIRSARVLVNGKRAKVVRKRGRLRARVDLRGLPRGTFRVLVTVRTAKGRTLRSARTYRTCTPKKRHRQRG